MRSFEYTVQNPLGLHAWPAGQFIAAARSYQSEIWIERSGKSADPKNLMSVLALNVKRGDTVRVTADGVDETEAIKGLEQFMRDYL